MLLSPLLLKLKNTRSSMTKAESIILDGILEDPSDFVKASAREFSKSIGVSDASVIRFCKKYNELGYQEFKDLLNKELVQSGESAKRAINPDIYSEDDLEVIVDKVESMINNSVRDTKALLNTKILRIAISELEKAKRLFFIGIGPSGLSAIDAGNKFARIGFDATGFDELYTMSAKLHYTTANDLVVVISHSGENESLLKNVKAARDNGSYIIAITQNKKSSIGKSADIVLQNCSQGDFYQGDSIGTRVSQMFLLNILYNETLKNNFDQMKLSRITLRKRHNELR